MNWGIAGRGFTFLAIILVSAISNLPLTYAAAPVAAKGKPAAAPTAVKAPDANKGFRKKELNFEERVIEGLSNKGYESLSQTGSSDGLKGEKLYRKRAEFDEDSKSLLREMEYLK
jgi:hypothetical protein